MLFNSYVFIFAFLPIVLLGFYTLRRLHAPRSALAWLVLASFFFYAWWNPPYLLLILASIAFNFIVGYILGVLSIGPGAERHARRRAVLIAGVAANLALLGYFKYANFFVDSVNAALDTSFHLHTIFLPLAISFFTFQQIAYLVDAYRGLVREYSFLDYALFVTFFPQLIAGPIVHHADLLPEFAKSLTPPPDRPPPPIADNLGVGLSIFILGLAKKVVLADSVSAWANQGFDAVAAGDTLSAPWAWIAVVAYALQIYFDFSGYSDMAIGLARMFGVRLALNFNSPYKAVNIADFWRRWHMTLSTFLRDYLYIPLGGNRCSSLCRYRNLFLTMLLGGMWHGAGWTFIIWGALHGLYLVLHRLWTSYAPASPLPSWLSRPLARALTLLCVLVAWVFFRADGVQAATSMLRSMAGLGSPTPHTWNPGELRSLAESIALILPLTAIALWLPNTQSIMTATDPTLPRQRDLVEPLPAAWLGWRPNVLWAAWIGAVGVFSVLLLSRAQEFLYFQF
jgi:alginate O-acetyltransferase complex protein AlgI